MRPKDRQLQLGIRITESTGYGSGGDATDDGDEGAGAAEVRHDGVEGYDNGGSDEHDDADGGAMGKEHTTATR